jgi:hypothetical protein
MHTRQTKSPFKCVFYFYLFKYIYVYAIPIAVVDMYNLGDIGVKQRPRKNAFSVLNNHFLVMIDDHHHLHLAFGTTTKTMYT